MATIRSHIENPAGRIFDKNEDKREWAQHCACMAMDIIRPQRRGRLL